MSKWVTAWGVPTSYVTEGIGNIMEDTTFRNVFYCPIRGEKVRIRFTNKYGDRDVKLDAVSIGEWKGSGPAVVPGTLVNFTFNDNGNIIKPGEELITDDVDYVLEPGKQYVLSYYFKDMTWLDTGYNGFANDPFSLCWLGRGDFVGAEMMDFKCRRELKSYVFLCGVEALSDDDTNAVMAFGDSITARPWPDYLARRINEAGFTNRSVVRKAIGGNRVLRDYRDCLPRRSMGLAAVDRFEMSIKQVLGVDKVIMLEGINDLYHPSEDSLFCGMDELPTADELIAGYKKCCDIAHKYGAKFYLCTILPTAHLENLGGGREERRNAVNEWIRTNDYIDGFIEFDKALADKDNPHIMAKEYDSGDVLHPNLEGSQALCNAVPEHIFN